MMVKKAPHLNLFAFHRVLEQLPEARLTMAGGGPLWATCRDLIKELMMLDRVTRNRGKFPSKGGVKAALL